MEQVLFWPSAGAAVLRLAGAHRRDALGGVPHRPLLPLELRRLPQPDGAPAVDRRAVFPDLLYLRESPAGGGPHRRRAHAAPAVRHGPVRRRTGGDRSVGAGLSGGGCGVLWPLFRLVRLGRAAAARCSCAGPPSGVRLGQRSPAGTPAALAGLCVDDSAPCPAGSASARGPEPLERELFYPVSPDPRDLGSGVRPVGGGGRGAVRPSGGGACAPRLRPGEKGLRKETADARDFQKSRASMPLAASAAAPAALGGCLLPCPQSGQLRRRMEPVLPLLRHRKLCPMAAGIRLRRLKRGHVVPPAI